MPAEEFSSNGHGDPFASRPQDLPRLGRRRGAARRPRPRRLRHRVNRDVNNVSDQPGGGGDDAGAGLESPYCAGESPAFDPADAWQQVLDSVKRQLPKPSFDTWVLPTRGIACHDEAFVVQAPSAFCIAWLERRLYQTLQKELEKVTGRALYLQFQVRSGSDPADEDEPGYDPCFGYPCLKDHWNQEHQLGMARYLELHWDIHDPQH